MIQHPFSNTNSFHWSNSQCYEMESTKGVTMLQSSVSNRYCSSLRPCQRGVRLHLGEGKRLVASVATLQLATGNEKRIRKKNELKDLCEGHRFHGLKLVEKSEIGP